MFMNNPRLILILFLSILMLFGCQEWGEPELNADEWVPPHGTADSQFLTIGPNNVNNRYLTRLHTNGNSPSLIVHPNDRFTRYLRAVVVSSDEGGNYYKSMVIQDSTGGVELQLDMTGLHTVYPVGQRVVIVLNGLVIGDYNNLTQVGWIYEGNQVGRINSLYFNQYIIRDGLPNLNNLPKTLTNNDIDFSSLKDINKLVRLEGVTFENNAIGEPFAYNNFATDWVVNVPLANGTTQPVTVRTSNFARFRSMIIEEKEYNLTGILTIFRNSYQLMIRTKDDIEASTSPSLITFDFTSNPVGEGRWSVQSLSGATQWGFRNNSMMHFGNTASGHNTAMDDWFISPEITYADLANGYLRFEHQLSVLNGNYDAYQVYYTTSNAATFNIIDWSPLGTLSAFPASFSWSNHLPISNIGANSFRIAFRYYAPDPNIETYDWRIRKVEIRNR